MIAAVGSTPTFYQTFLVHTAIVPAVKLSDWAQWPFNLLCKLIRWWAIHSDGALGTCRTSLVLLQNLPRTGSWEPNINIVWGKITLQLWPPLRGLQRGPALDPLVTQRIHKRLYHGHFFIYVLLVEQQVLGHNIKQAITHALLVRLENTKKENKSVK